MSEQERIETYYKGKSFWLDTCGETLQPRKSLENSISTDIAILGGGYTGLWTAYYLKRKMPHLNIVILEKEIVGFGGSGRNGGWCSPKFPISPLESIKRYGLENTKQINKEMFNTVKEIERIIDMEALDIDWKLGGSLEVTKSKKELPMLEKKLDLYKSLGLGDELELLSKDEVNERVNINGVEAGLYTKTSAVLNPAKLVRQLAEVVEKLGVTIYEQTEVSDYEDGESGKSPYFVTEKGNVTANCAIVISGESYLSQMKKLKRKVLPMYSLITITDPLSEAELDHIGWENRESVGSTRLSVEYLQKTKDNRILFGSRGQPYRFGSKISDSLDYHKETDEHLKRQIRKWFPSLNNINFSHSWGGPVGVTRDWAPNLFFNKESKVAGAWGFAGQGVSTSNLAGRIICDLILEEVNDILSLPIVNHHSRKWEVEPFRWLGARFVQRGLEKVDEKSTLTGVPPKGNTIAERLANH